jgi:hypothetical protein
MPGLDDIPKHLRSLQTLIDRFNDAEDPDDRDEVLADIINHDSAESLQFLRLVAEQEEDAYTRCDAVAGLFTRTEGQEGKETLLKYPENNDEAYQYCRAAEVLSEHVAKEALEPLWQAWGKSLRIEQIHQTIFALENLDPETTAERFVSELAAYTQPETIPFERADLMLKALARLKVEKTKEPLRAVDKHLRELGKQFPDDAVDLEELADQVIETLRLYDVGETDE